MAVRAIQIIEDGREVRVESQAGKFDFAYSCKGFRIMGHKFEPKLCYRTKRTRDFWRAQLAFRGLNSSINKIKVLKERLGTADTRRMDPNVVRVRTELKTEWRRLQNLRRYITSNHEMWDLAAQKPVEFLKYLFLDEEGNDWGAEPVAIIDPDEEAVRKLFVVAGGLYVKETVKEDLVIGSRSNRLGNDMVEKLNKMAQNEECAKIREKMEPASSSTPITTAMGPEKEPESLRGDLDCWIIGSRTLRTEIPDSEDEEEILYSGQFPRRNIPKPTEIQTNIFSNQNRKSTIPRPQEIRMRDLDEDSCSDVGWSIPSDEWDITGVWRLESSHLTTCFGPVSFSMEIFTNIHGGERESFGRLSCFKFDGIFRLSKIRKPAGHHKRVSCEDKTEFLLKMTDNPSTKSPTRYFRWRGYENKTEGRVLMTDADQSLYTMTFSEGGKKVRGTWGTPHPIPGNVIFSGSKVEESDPFATFNIRQEWKSRMGVN
ncbi:hypothetical protein G7Y89_g14676 [Cudoniella acicularis]|uniref:Uncharacterized protein n=1 Tax=Cudoniella acicularis TaxID=354080 RepID=A0A8H4QZ23_9HELO|nr:hypothetical protein G7Y89_g14676 [Cudoniella acicularis]